MSTAPSLQHESETLADILRDLGDIPAERVRSSPAPRSGTEEDVVEIQERTKRLCELYDGVLVEKPVGWREATLALWLGHYLASYLEKNDLGLALGEGGLMRVAPGQVRIPDVAFYNWEQFPGRVLPPGSILDRVPNLAVEILSPSNTRREMARKRREYFAGGCQIVWEVEPEDRLVRVYRSAKEFVTLEEDDTLDGGEVLPGFELSIAKWFEKALTNQK